MDEEKIVREIGATFEYYLRSQQMGWIQRAVQEGTREAVAKAIAKGKFKIK